MPPARRSPPAIPARPAPEPSPVSPQPARPGDQRHRRAAAHQPRPGAARRRRAEPAAYAQPRARPGDGPARLAPGATRRRCWPRVPAPRRPWSSTTAPPPCCWCSPRWPRGRAVVVSAGRAGRDRRRLPRPRGDGRSRAPGSSRSAPPTAPGCADYSAPRRSATTALSCSRCTSRTTASSGFTEPRRRRRARRRSGLPVVVDIGSGLLDAASPWLAGGPPPWLAGEPAARQTLRGAAPPW